ncbi:transporter substrate-binding domain-containing protein [Pseudoalteromonas tunicata]|jgi:polar amino acid transport system substrate-binding protein|uniref:ABC-type amino acid transport/signal transduction systems, periplasmic component/domain n=1 Tax=Pseudoalteromonas tunicata D2 TaxID=87626 RepID=A4C4Q7_9GAMM|nr:transporter substrate-binding domain-containing protein [Pseudoalteromonas tunicata]ATC96982.1 hypothetical protein PTUN_b0629 [Pseudoalteromonas tunicata]AXT33105.1 amino acid ABC transporter substrate-binding protein [Pseudoalteromonas tunicata]EAR30539.1 ABC-type amino acid transport/signal transduction systems, periplasmic component/domain [Pseudoalteromonas tunicata D2]MDP4982131.1 transporter substrate-binding domain-containing protein [Pseudoalteromonas tunicata]
MIKKLFTLFMLVVFPSLCWAKLNIVTEVLPNYQYYNDDNQLIGISTERVIKALTQGNIEYSLLVYPWSVAYSAALRDPQTCIFSLARIAPREDKFQWIAKLHHANVSFYSLKTSHISIGSVEDAKQYKIAVLRDNFSHHYLKSKGFTEDKNLIVIDHFEKIYDLLETRRELLELLVLNDEQFNYSLKHNKTLSKLKPIFQIDSIGQELYFACHKDMANDTIEALKQAFKRSE